MLFPVLNLIVCEDQAKSIVWRVCTGGFVGVPHPPFHWVNLIISEKYGVEFGFDHFRRVHCKGVAFWAKNFDVARGVRMFAPASAYFCVLFFDSDNFFTV